jgi:hypothetical protein
MKKQRSVSVQKFFEAVASTPRGAHSMGVQGDIVVHILTGPMDTVIIPIKDIFEELEAEDIVVWLIQIGLLELIPKLVPNHPLAKTIRRLPPPNH